MRVIQRNILIALLLALMPGAMAQDLNIENIRGYDKVGETKTYNNDNLFEYINGAAEFYFTYNFKKLFVTHFKKGESEITMDIFMHESPAMAFGVFSMERPLSVKNAGIGKYGYAVESILNLCKNEYYIKFNASNIKEEDLINFAREAVDRIPGSFNEIKQLQYFPEEDYISGSAQFIATDFLGYGFLTNAFIKKYQNKQKDYFLYVIEAKDSESAFQKLQEYAEITSTEIPELLKDGNAKFIDDPFNGVQRLVKYDRYLIGMANPGDSEKADVYLNQIIKNIKKP